MLREPARTSASATCMDGGRASRPLGSARSMETSRLDSVRVSPPMGSVPAMAAEPPEPARTEPWTASATPSGAMVRLMSEPHQGPERVPVHHHPGILHDRAADGGSGRPLHELDRGIVPSAQATQPHLRPGIGADAVQADDLRLGGGGEPVSGIQPRGRNGVRAWPGAVGHVPPPRSGGGAGGWGCTKSRPGATGRRARLVRQPPGRLPPRLPGIGRALQAAGG